MWKLCEMSKRFGMASSALVVGAMATAACAADAKPSDASDTLAEVTLANGTVVSFYEPQPGAIAIAQDAPIGVAPVVVNHMSAVQLFQSIAPGQAVPAALVAAQARVDQDLAANANHQATATPRLTDIHSDITDSDFESKYCYNESWSIIHCDPGMTTGHSGSASDVDAFKIATCVNTGKVTMKASVDGELKISKDVLPGFCLWYEWDSGLSNEDVTDQIVVDQTPVDYDFSFRENH